MQEVRAGVVAHRGGAALGVDDGTHRLPYSEPAVELAAMDDQPAEPLLRVLDREQLRPFSDLADDAAVADLAAALRVERRPIEDDLGRALAGQLLELHPVADDGEHPGVRGRRLVAEELRVAG